jgi:quercetin dioxygenase-like cupin family protein
MHPHGAGTGRAYVLGEEDGKAMSFLGAHLLTKATAENTGGSFCLFDQRVPPNYAVPRHIHRDDDEAWYILDGSATFFCGDQRFEAGKGAWIFLPRGVAHTFKAGASGARLLTMTAPAGFAAFVEAVGQPAEEAAAHPVAPPDEAMLAQIAARYGIELVGPPPA